MKKNVFLSLFWVLCAVAWLDPQAKAQALSGSSLNITGTGTISALVSNTASIVSGSMGSLVVGGTADILGNTLYFGSWTSDPTKPGGALLYNDGSSGVGSSLTQIVTRPQAVWNWQRLTQSGSATNVMQIDGSNRLILTGTTPTQQLVLDPANQGGPTSVLTQQIADSRYVSSMDILVGTDQWGYGSPTIALRGGNATGPFSFAAFNSIASGYSSIASGNSSVATGEGSVASGYCAAAEGQYSVASGYLSRATGTWSTAIGPMSVATDDWAVAIGNISCATAHGAMTIGANSTACGRESFTLRDGGFASGTRATSCGPSSSAIGDWSTASGPESIANGWGSISMGFHTTTQGFLQTAVGICNIPQGNPSAWVLTDDLFIIGNGIFSCDVWGNPLFDENGNQLPDVQSNAFVIKKNGDTTIYGALTVSGTNAGIVVTGTAVQVPNTSGTGTITTVVASGSTQLVLIPQQGDLAMGNFVNGAQPLPAESSQRSQQSMQRISSSQVTAGDPTSPHLSGTTSASLRTR